MKKMADAKPPDKDGRGQHSSSAKDKKAHKIRDTIEVPKWLFFSTFVFVGFISVMMGSYMVYTKFNIPEPPSFDLIHNVGQQGILLFEQHDRDNDGYLSIEEFEPIIYQLLEANATGEVYTLPIAVGDDVVTIKAYFKPLRLETMSTDINEKFGNLDAFVNLKSWANPAIEWMNIGAPHFAVFLPPNTEHIDLGVPYDIVEPASSFFDNTVGASQSSNRYYPPHVAKNHQLLHQLLTMFHPRPFLISRFDPTGSMAVVRSVNDHLLEIYFRIHAEFQLNEPPHHPFWFTPAQFTGNVIMSRDASRIVYFNLYVPNDRKLNVDMEWMNGSKEFSLEADIGYIPLMKLNNTAASRPLLNDNMLLKDMYNPEDPTLAAQMERIQWTSRFSVEDALRVMEVQMYPFKKIPYYNFTEVFKKAEEEHKLVHSILLWGALDDQSC